MDCILEKKTCPRCKGSGLTHNGTIDGGVEDCPCMKGFISEDLVIKLPISEEDIPTLKWIRDFAMQGKTNRFREDNGLNIVVLCELLLGILE